jgi:hypothetical protein
LCPVVLAPGGDHAVLMNAVEVLEDPQCVAVANTFPQVFREDLSSRIALPPLQLAFKQAPVITKAMWCQAFKHTPQERTFLDGEVKMWLQCAALYKHGGPSQVCSPLFSTGIPDGKPRQRSVVGLQNVSDLMQDVSFPLLPFDDLLQRTCGAQVYSLLDLQVRIPPAGAA